jgi:hypothetical protein
MHVLPYKILIDTAEQHPFAFRNIKGDAAQKYQPIHVPTQCVCLGRYPHSLGDYSIEGLTERVAVERKSKTDCQGTILGFNDQHRDRFEKELENFAKLDSAMVVVEATFWDVVTTAPEWGKKTAKQNGKIIYRSVLAFMQDYKIPWLFCDSRRLAELSTFRFLDRFYRRYR